MGGVVLAWVRSGAAVKAGTFDVSWGLLGSTLAWAIGIAVLATLLAWPAAWVVRARKGEGLVLLLVPLIVPAHLVYAGLNMLRAPRSVLGDWLEGLVNHGATWAPVAAGKLAALLGLALWAAPLSALVLGTGLSRVDTRVLDELRLEARGLRLGLAVMGLCRGWIAGSVLMVSLIMIGSAVPLHLAQAATYSLRVWADLLLTPGDIGTIASAWPLLVIAGVAGWVLGGWIGGSDVAAGEAHEGAGASRWHRVYGIGLGLCASVLPLGLLATGIPGLEQVRVFWGFNAGALGRSIGLGLGVGLGCAAIAGATSFCMSCSGWPARVAGMVTRLLLIAGLCPGVVIGAAWMATAKGLGARWLEDSSLIVALAQLSRYGFLGAVSGVWLSRTDWREFRELRRIEGAGGLIGWALLCLPLQWVGLSGVLFAGLALSLNEVEATTMVVPPGSGVFAMTLLGFMHYSRLEDLSIAGMLLGCVGGFIGLVLYLLAGRGLKAWAGR